MALVAQTTAIIETIPKIARSMLRAVSISSAAHCLAASVA